MEAAQIFTSLEAFLLDSAEPDFKCVLWLVFRILSHGSKMVEPNDDA